MGKLIEDTKPAGNNKSSNAFLAVIASIVLVLLQLFANIIFGIGAFIGKHIAAPILGQLLSFEGLDRLERRRKLGIILTCILSILLIGALLIYKIPLVRDYLTLSLKQTVNVDNYAGTIWMPPKEYFYPVAARTFLQHGNDSRRYITYTGHGKDLRRELHLEDCQVVYRGETILISSASAPIYAVGFEDAVTYLRAIPASRVTGWRSYLMYAEHPGYMLMKEEQLASITYMYELTSTWTEFLNDWDSIYTYPGGDKYVEVKALWNEHAMVCI